MRFTSHKLGLAHDDGDLACALSHSLSLFFFVTRENPAHIQPRFPCASLLVLFSNGSLLEFNPLHSRYELGIIHNIAGDGDVYVLSIITIILSNEQSPSSLFPFSPQPPIASA